MVGGPGIMEMRSLAMRGSTASRSKLFTGSMWAPRMIADSHPALYPKEWKNGLIIR